MKKHFMNISLLLITIVIISLVLETVIFRIALPAPDFPSCIDFQQGVVKYCPLQQGTRVSACGDLTTYSINKHGWNSTKSSYLPNESDHNPRILIIGDSYVEGLSVDVDKHFGEVLERNSPKKIDVMRMGIGGAPLSQYLHMIRQEGLNYKPNIIIVNIVHNDFDESFCDNDSLYNSSFLKLSLNEGCISEVSPAPYRQSYKDLIRKSATWRYLRYKKNISFHFIKSCIFGARQSENDLAFEKIEEDHLILALDYIFQSIKILTAQDDVKIMITVDGARDIIYHCGHNSTTSINSKALKLNNLVKDVSSSHGFFFLDLHDVFVNDYIQNKKRFDFTDDYHWNEYGNAIVGKAILQYFITESLI